MHIYRFNPIIGVGTGDLNRAFASAYEAIDSSLQLPFRLRAHNQYVTFLLSGGPIALILWLTILASFYFSIQSLPDRGAALLFRATERVHRPISSDQHAGGSNPGRAGSAGLPPPWRRSRMCATCTWRGRLPSVLDMTLLGHLRHCWRMRLRDAFAAQNVSIIVRVGRAASACVFQSRSGVAWFVCDAARLSLTGGLCHTRLPSLNARALSKQV